MLALIFQRTVAFLMTHAIGLSAVILVVPIALTKIESDPQLISLVGTFSQALLPSIFFDAINR